MRSGSLGRAARTEFARRRSSYSRWTRRKFPRFHSYLFCVASCIIPITRNLKIG